MKRVSIYEKLVLSFIIFFLLAFFAKGSDTSDFIKIILSSASFLFGIIIAFSIADRHNRLSSIRKSLREQDALLLNTYMLSGLFEKKVLEETRRRIDSFLISQIDYKLVDFNKESPKKLKELYRFLENLKIKNKNQEQAVKKILDNLEGLEKIQKEVDYQVNNKMPLFEWINLLILGLTILFCLFYVNTGSLISVIIVSALSASLLFLLFVLDELNSLMWQEKSWIWEPLSNLFIQLDLIPYFPEGVFKKERLKIEHLKEFNTARIARYPDPYPNMLNKKIEVITL
jgi:ABC-type multidrug transport system fused ATPase/permease subunit